MLGRVPPHSEGNIDNVTMLSSPKQLIYNLLKSDMKLEHPRTFQVEAIYELMYNSNDVFLARKTGEGNSVVLQGCCCICAGVVICLTPLLGLTPQQSQQMQFLSLEGIFIFYVDSLEKADADELNAFLASFQSIHDFDKINKSTIVLFCSPLTLAKSKLLC